MTSNVPDLKQVRWYSFDVARWIFRASPSIATRIGMQHAVIRYVTNAGYWYRLAMSMVFEQAEMGSLGLSDQGSSQHRPDQ